MAKTNNDKTELRDKIKLIIEKGINGYTAGIMGLNDIADEVIFVCKKSENDDNVEGVIKDLKEFLDLKRIEMNLKEILRRRNEVMTEIKNKIAELKIEKNGLKNYNINEEAILYFKKRWEDEIQFYDTLYTKLI